MASYPRTTDRTNVIVIQPEITRAFWSRPRAWNGAELTLTVETRWVPDDTELVIKIYEDDSAEGSDDDLIETLPSAKIKDGRCRIEHKLEWDEATLGAERASEGDEPEFYFLVTIEQFQLRGRSNLLYVDLGGFEVSR